MKQIAVSTFLAAFWLGLACTARAQQPGDRLAEALAERRDAPVPAGPRGPSLEQARQAIRRNHWNRGVLFGSLGAANLTTGLVLLPRSDADGSAARGRRLGFGISSLALGAGELISAVVAFAEMPAYRDTRKVPEALRGSRARDTWWLRWLAPPLLVASMLGAGLGMYALADDPVVQGLGLGLAAQTVGASIKMGFGARTRNRLRPFYELVD